MKNLAKDCYDNGNLESKNDGNIKPETKSMLEGYETFTNEYAPLLDLETEQKIWNEDGRLTLFGRKYELDGEYYISTSWYWCIVNCHT